MTDLNQHPLAVADADRSQRTLSHGRRLVSHGLILLALGGGGRFLINHLHAQDLASATKESLLRTVIVTQAREGELKRNATLPATLRGNNDILLYARSNGYVAAWHKTIGDKVGKGELLATIDAPEQDQELAQARANREQVKARLFLTKTTAERWEALRQQDGVSQQELEEKRGALTQAQADLAAAEANVKRLEQLQGFRRIVAPFAGVVTKRNVEVGQLVGAGGKELFAISQTDPLRLTVWVPQSYANELKLGKEVNVSLNEFPGKKFTAVIEHVAGGIDPLNRSRQVDITLPNPDGKLLPGSYAEVVIGLTSGVKALVVPASVLVIGSDGPKVATIRDGEKVAFHAVKLGRDLGREVEIVSGINREDKLVVSPSDLLTEGDTVKTETLATNDDKSKRDTKADTLAKPNDSGKPLTTDTAKLAGRKP
ncbi:MAG: efflux RND transporter periplasmic adaptor subunit [Rhodocyclaceae bacterium]|nr:MAG: efflux RND transporter periplasmic adaptor subunit [Rhodocyclaceae bacterium]